MSDRPSYVGIGTCDCKRMDVRLYRAPLENRPWRLACNQCLAAGGIETPKPRTADDIEVDEDGNMKWRR
jgi:hypothetical protein